MTTLCTEFKLVAFGAAKSLSRRWRKMTDVGELLKTKFLLSCMFEHFIKFLTIIVGSVAERVGACFNDDRALSVQLSPRTSH